MKHNIRISEFILETPATKDRKREETRDKIRHGQKQRTNLKLTDSLFLFIFGHQQIIQHETKQIHEQK